MPCHSALLDSTPDTIAALMAAFRAGDSSAGARLIEMFYPELKHMASAQFQGERQDHSWQPTLLVNELYLELVRIKELAPREGDIGNEKAAFLGLAGKIMKRLLIHHSRPLSSKAKKVPVFDDVLFGSDADVLEIKQLLSQLDAIKPEIRLVVEMKVFEGLTAGEIASRLGCATVTINRYWQFACQWLRKTWTP